MSVIPWWIKYPYVNDEIQNLDWLLTQVDENTDKIKDFINLNTIKYANPILWDITSQYEANTIVVDPQTGDAYISVAAVPYGVSLSNTTYWTKIYNYADAINNLQEQIAIANEELSTTATAARSIGDLVWLNGELYEVIAAMIPGDTYVENSNCIKTTIEEYVNTRFTAIHQLLAYMGDLANLNTTDKSTLVAAINEVHTTITDITGDLANLNTTDKSTLVAAINEVLATVTYILASRTKSYVLVSDMIADTDLTVGEVVSTLGYHVAGIGGATYEISATAGTAAITLANGLYANIQVSDEIYLAQLGAESNDDISSLLADAVTLINKRGVVHLDAWYKINNAVNINLSTNDNLTIDGHENNIFFDDNSSVINFTVTGTYDRNVNIINCDFTGNNSNSCLTFTGFSSALNRNEIRNCNFSNFKNNIFIQNSRMFLIDNIAIWGLPDDGIGINLYATDTNFVGDLEIKNSQFTTANGASGNGLHIGFNLASGATCASVIIDSCDFYEADYCIRNLGNGTYNDIWILNSQFDGASNYSINFTGSGQMNNIQIKNNYDTAPKDFLTLYMPTSIIKALSVESNYINGYTGTTPAININCNNDSSVNVCENIFINSINTSGALIGVYNVRSAKVSGNICDLDSGYSLYNVVELNACINAICTNNIANNVSNTAYVDASNTNKVFANNIP